MATHTSGDPSKAARWLVAAWLLAAGAGPGRAGDDAAVVAAQQKAQALRGMGKLGEAIAQFERAVSLAGRVFGADSLEAAGLLHELGQLYRDTDQLDRAEAALARSLKNAEAVLGADHADVATILESLSLVHNRQGEAARAEPLLRRCLKIREARFGKDHPLVANTLNELALTCADLGRHEIAEPLYRRSLAIYEARLGPNAANAVNVRNNLAMLYYKTEQYDKAEPLYVRSLAAKEALLGPDHPDVATVAANLGKLYEQMGAHAKAEPLLERSLGIREAKLGKDHVQVAHSLSHLGDLYRRTGRFDRAAENYQRCLRILELRRGGGHPEVATALTALALVYQLTGEDVRARDLYLRALRIDEARKDDRAAAVTLNNLAAVYQSLGQYGQAEDLYRRGLAIREAKLGQYDKAEPLFARCLRIQEQKLGPGHRDVAVTLTNLGRLYDERGRHAEAEAVLRRAVAIHEAGGGVDAFELAGPLNNLGSACQHLGRVADAIARYERCLRITEKHFGKNSIKAVATLNNLAGVYQDTGQYAHAEPLYRRCLDILGDRLGASHPRVITAWNNLATLYAADGAWAKAADACDRGRRMQREHIVRTLVALPEAEQLAYLRHEDAAPLHWVLSLGLHRKDDAKIVEQSAAWLLNGKAVARQALAERTLLSRDGADPKLARLVVELREVRSRLARLALATPAPGAEEGLRRTWEALVAKEADLGKRLGRDGGAVRPAPWVELGAVRTALPADAVVVEMARFDVRAFGARPGEPRWQPARYAAWVIPPPGRGAVTLVDLGPADRIDAAVAAVRRGMAAAPRQVRELGEPDAERALRPALQALADLVLEPLRPHLAKAPRWLLSPDGALWLVSWAALPWTKDSYVAEHHLVSYLVSGRDVLAAPATGAVQPPQLFADPDYDAAPAPLAARPRAAVPLTGQRLRGTIGDWKVSFAFHEGGRLVIHDEDAGGEVAGEGRWTLEGATLTLQTKLARFEGTVQGGTIGGKRTTAEGTDAWQCRLPPGLVAPADDDGLRSAGARLKLPARVPRLGGTAVEAALVLPRLKSFTGESPRLHVGAEASEAAVKALRRPRVLVLATHGYFLAAPPAPPADPAARPKHAATDARAQPVDHPLLCCGLLLAGCNRRAQAGPDEDDGVLTGLEVVGLDLRGCELVVLSACETGLGEVQEGEGVAGLRQCFQLAGAGTVVATLWQIPDRPSAQQMARFFELLAAKKGKAEALAQAQRDRIAARREEFGAAHPFFWAAFTVTGEPPAPANP